ncbi:hypothetical protein NDU88_005338 [Pleurodeles waltl]|uniref:Uncharacterized protein n=1 Tax=Pleurodeles waltl TaxID=8319 RepID=A0AAV7WZ86_PLEWA|nr:hypothetical protein NDU88_005338 [Pleurodeles waltl]
MPPSPKVPHTLRLCGKTAPLACSTEAPSPKEPEPQRPCNLLRPHRRSPNCRSTEAPSPKKRPRNLLPEFNADSGTRIQKQGIDASVTNEGNQKLLVPKRQCEK